MGELASPGPELARANRRVIAERTGWPDGAVEDCEKVEAAAPDWWASWSDGGYFAGRRKWHRDDPGPRYLHGATPQELAARIEQAPVVQHGLAEYRPLHLPGD